MRFFFALFGSLVELSSSESECDKGEPREHE